MNFEIKKLEKHTDPRGWLVEFLKQSETTEKIQQIYIASLEPGTIRGNHYHQKRIE